MRRLCFLVHLFLLLAPAATAQVAAPGVDVFSLEPGDVVRVKIWREKDLDGEYSVDERGRLTLPLLGVRQVVGVPWNALRDSLLAAYAVELKAPSVILIPLRRVHVLGEVTKPGMYLADPTTSLAGAIALAGGASPLGDLGRVRVVRKGQTIVEGRAVDDDLLKAGVRTDDQIFVDRRSWFDRNSAFVASALVSLVSIAVTLLRR